MDIESIQQQYQQQLFEREANREKYGADLSDDEFRILNQVYTDEQEDEEYINNRYRAATAMKLSRNYGVPYDFVYGNLDDLMGSEYPHIDTPKAWYKAVSDSFALGTNQKKLAALGVRLMAVPESNSEERNKLWKEIEAIGNENLSLKDGVRRNWFLEGLKGFGESWAFTASSAGAGILGTLGTPALGIVSAAAVSSVDMAGLEYVNLLNEGVDNETARRVALSSGIIQGVLEALVGDIPALGSRTALGQLIFKRLHYAGVFGIAARTLGARAIDSGMEGAGEGAQEFVSQRFTEQAKQQTEAQVHAAVARGERYQDPAEQAAEDLATAAFREYYRETSTPGNEANRLDRPSADEQNREIWESLRVGFLTSLITGIPVIGRDLYVNAKELRQINAVMKTTQDIETANTILEKAGNKTYENFTEETRQELHTAAAQERERAEAAAEEEYRRTRLYGGQDQSEGPVYREADGRLYAENIRHTESNGVTTGTYQGGNPAKTEDNTYWKITYEMEGDRAVIDRVRIAEKYENLKSEILQGFSNDLNQEVSWEGSTYTPQAGTAPALHIGWDDKKPPKNAAPEPSRTAAGGLKPLDAGERQFFDRLKKTMPRVSNLEARAIVEQFRVGADLQNVSFDEYLAGNFQEGVFSDTNANTLAAAREDGGRKKGGIQFDRETGKALISGSTWADFSTASHEFAHALRRQLTGEYLTEAERVFGVENGVWTEEQEEAFSRSYEKYLETGTAPTSKLRELFRKFKEFMGRVYRLVKNEGVLTADQQALFDRIFRDAEANREAREAAGSGEQAGSPTSTERAKTADEQWTEEMARDWAEKTAQGTAKEGAEEIFYQADTRSEDEIINDPEAGYEEKARAVVDKAGKVYAALKGPDPATRGWVKEQLINTLKSSAVPMDNHEFSREEYNKVFPRGIVETPIGQVKIGENQFEKLASKDKGKRKFLIGAMYQTLSDPIAIIREKRDDKIANVFIKSFTGMEGKEIDTVLTVVVDINQKQIAISTYKRKYREVISKIKKADGIVYIRDNSGSLTNGANPRHNQVSGKNGEKSSPETLFQDEEAMAAFLRNDPGVLDLAASFDSWEDFMGYYEAFDEKQGAELRETAAREGFYKTIFEEAQRLKTRETAAETADTGQKTAEDFIDLVNSETGLVEIVETTHGILELAGHFKPESAEEEQRFNAELRAVKTAFNHPNWEIARGKLSKNELISPTTARFLRGQVRNNPLSYMEAWAVISGDDSWLPAEQRSRLDSGSGFDYETDKSPEELRRIQQALDYEEIVRKIEDGSLQAGDPQIENYEEDLKRRQQENQEKIDKKKEKLADYAQMIERAEINIHGQEKLLIQLAADTTPEGLKAQSAQQRKIKALQNQLLQLRKEYARFFQTVKTEDKANFKDFTTLVRMQAKTEQSLKALKDLRQIRKREFRALTRKPDLKTVHIDEAYEIQWMQSHFDNLEEAAPKFIGPKAKNLQRLFSDFTTDEQYRDRVRETVQTKKGTDWNYRRIEKIVYKDVAKGEVRPYSELTKAQRHTLYRLLPESEGIFKEAGLDEMEPPKQFSEAESERIRKGLEGRLPSHIMNKLESRVPLDRWQMSDMETLATFMGELRKKGREHYQARQDARRKVVSDYQKQFTARIEKLLRPKDLERLPGQQTEEEEKKRAKPWNLLFSGINARRFVRMLEGGKDGLMHDVIIGGEDRAFNEQMRHELRRRKLVEEQLKNAKIKLKELWSNTFMVDEGGIAKTIRTLDELLFYRRAALNERAYAAVVFGNFGTPTELAAMEAANNGGRPGDALTMQNKILKRYQDAMEQLDTFLAKPENKKFEAVESIIGRDYDGNYDRLKEFAAQEFNFDMGSEAFYIPLARLEATGDPMEHETIQEVFSSAGVVQSLEKGFTLGRIDIAPWHQKPVKAGLYKTWDQMVTKQEHLMAYSGYLREMRQVFEDWGSEVLMSNIKRRFSRAATDYITHYISELAGPNPQRDYTNLDTITRLVRGHYPAAVLGFRLSSIIKQAITSPPPFFQFVSVGEYAAAAMECLSEDTRKMIREKSVYMASRVIDPANEFIRQMEMSSLMGKGGKLEAGLAKVENIGMKGLEWIDSVCVMPGWWAAYKQKQAQLNGKKEIDENTIEAEAVKYADQVVRDTQPSSRQVDLAPIFKHQKNPFMQMFLQFQVPQSVIMQNLFVDAPNNFKQGRWGAALTTIALYGLTAAVVGLLEEDEDDEKLNLKYRGIDAAMGYLESIPLAGGYVSYTVEHLLRTGKLKLSQVKPFPVLDEAFRAGAAVTQEQWDQAFFRSLKALGYYSGLPVGSAGEIEKAIKEGDLGILFGYK